MAVSPVIRVTRVLGKISIFGCFQTASAIDFAQLKSPFRMITVTFLAYFAKKMDSSAAW